VNGAQKGRCITEVRIADSADRCVLGPFRRGRSAGEYSPRTRSVAVLAALAALALVACVNRHRPEQMDRKTLPQARAAEPPRGVRSVSEIDAVTAVTELSGAAYVSVSGQLWRFDPLLRPMSHPTGEPGKPVVALAAHPAQGLWAATRDGLVARLESDGWTVVTSPEVGSVRVLHASSGGVWVAGSEAVARWEGESWRRFPLESAATELQDQPDGKLWIGAEQGAYLLQGSRLRVYGPAQGQPLRRVDEMTVTAAGGLVAVGRDARGSGLLAHFDGSRWTAHRASVPLAFDWVGRRGHDVLVSSVGRVFRLVQLRGGERQTPPRRMLVLEAEVGSDAPAGFPAPLLALDPLPLELPPATVVADGGQSLLVGTRGLGVARVAARHVDWLRPRTLARGERRLNAGCLGSRCFVALRGRVVSHTNGTGFRLHPLPGLPADSRVHVFMPGPSGKVWLLHGSPRASRLLLSELDQDGLRQLHEVPIGTATTVLRARFARFAPRGELWIGLSRLDEGNLERPWGVAVVSHGELLAHHRSVEPDEQRRPAVDLVIPDDVRDVTFGNMGEAWLATAAGVIRIANAEATEYTENDGLASEISYAIGWTPSGEAAVGTLRGVGRFDGAHWRFDLGPALERSTRALLSEGSQLWAGTSSGLVKWQAGVISVLSRANGLLAEGVLDLFRAPDGALWVLTEEGISIVRE
jgi:hypothetical protein